MNPLARKLKSGEYDGADIMAAWIAIEQHDQLQRENKAYSITVTNLEARCDKLVELNKELVEALTDQLNDCINFNGSMLSEDVMARSSLTLTKAKELTNGK